MKRINQPERQKCVKIGTGRLGRVPGNHQYCGQALCYIKRKISVFSFAREVFEQRGGPNGAADRN